MPTEQVVTIQTKKQVLLEAIRRGQVNLRPEQVEAARPPQIESWLDAIGMGSGSRSGAQTEDARRRGLDAANRGSGAEPDDSEVDGEDEDERVRPGGEGRVPQPSNKPTLEQVIAQKTKPWDDHLSSPGRCPAPEPQLPPPFGPPPFEVEVAERLAPHLMPIIEKAQEAMSQQQEDMAKMMQNLQQQERKVNPIKELQITVKDEDGAVKAKHVSNGEHYQFEDLLKLVAIRTATMLVGPAGSGKTVAAEHAAKAVDLPFYCQSVCMQTSKVELLGYQDASGRYVKTNFRRAFEDGGLFLLDEIDSGNANVLTVLNSALSNNVCAFPDGMVKQNEKFVLVAAANTFGHGADRVYVGRCQLDAATLDRFAVINWEIDESLEDRAAGNLPWSKLVQQIRAVLAHDGSRYIVSPRASIIGAKMLKAGFKQEQVEKMLVWKGMPSDLVRRIKHALNAPKAVKNGN